jgi:hypothetical protein
MIMVMAAFRAIMVMIMVAMMVFSWLVRPDSRYLNKKQNQEDYRSTLA